MISDLEANMKEAAANLEFEEAARLRDEIRRMEAAELGLTAPGCPSLANRHGQFPAGTPGAGKKAPPPLNTPHNAVKIMPHDHGARPFRTANKQRSVLVCTRRKNDYFLNKLSIF